ncbi:MAG: hypothetical protein HYW08_16825, partial [candidate division NC10 bacterium]|nr:hypothetical protein [candidate division NC10 bacterium]
ERGATCLAVERIRAKATAAGLDRMSMDDIDAVIAEARRQRRAAR